MIEVGKEGSLGMAKAGFHAALAVDAAAAPVPGEAIDKGLAVLKQADNGAEADLGDGPGKHCPAAGAAPGGQVSGAGQGLDDLGQMVAREAQNRGQFGRGKAALWLARHVHQDPQSVIGEGSEAHRLT